MSVNKYKPHLYIIPEDHRDEQIANGFVNHPSVAARQVLVANCPGGWHKVLDTFKEEYVHLLRNNLVAHVTLLVDFDRAPEHRRQLFLDETPDDLQARVFVVGPHDTPETLSQSLGKRYEEIGKALADDCAGNTTEVWAHEQLRHNDSDRLRLVERVRPFLFPRDR